MGYIRCAFSLLSFKKYFKGKIILYCVEMAETPNTMDIEKRDVVNGALVDTEKYRDVSLPTSTPDQVSLKLTRGRKVAIATFLILCNSVLVGILFMEDRGTRNSD